MKKSLLTILCVLLSTMSWAQGTTAGDSTAVAEPYAVLSENNTVLTFYYDENKTSRNGMSVEPVSGPYAIPWYDAHNTITNVVFEPAFGKCTTLTSTANWFYECTALTSISGIEYLNTTNVTDMHQMFTGCTSLTSLTLDGLNTSNVANMNSMFLSCSALTQLSININTENVTDMGYMFQYCGALTSLDLSSFNTAKVTEMEYIFYDCSQVTTIYVGSGWINNPDIHANDMFHGCSSLVGGNGTAFDSRYTSYAYAHIDGGTDNPGYFTDKNASYNEAYGVLVIDENNTASLTMYFDANRDAHREGQVIGLDEMMQNQAWMMYRENVTTVVFDSSFANCRPTSTAFWFAYCRSLTSIVGLQYLRTDETTNMSFMFNECSSLTSLDLSSLNTENVTNISGMLGGCRSLTSVDLSGFNTRQVTNMNSLFEQSAALTTINLSSFNTSQVTDMSYMFNECSALTTIYVGSDWSTEAVTNGTDMFNKCTNLVGGAGTTFSADHIDHTYARIDAEGTPGYLTDSKNASMTHFVMITVEGNGEVSAGQAAVIRDRGDVHVANGEPLEMFFFPDEGYQLASVKIDTLDVTSQVTPATEYSAASYTIPGVYGDIAITVTFAQTSTDAEAYAVLSDNNTILTFYYDDQKAGRGGMSVGPFEKSSNVGWYSVRRNIQTVVFDASFADCTSITSTTFWFNGFNSLDKIEGMENLKTDNVTNMSGMFAGCRVTNIDFSKLNTSNVTDMSMMFCEIKGDLSASLDLSSFNTSKVTDMTEMFVESSGLSSINLSGFDTSNVTAMEDMFGECSALTSLDLSSFNTSNVANMGGLFRGCTALTTIYAGNEWSTDKVTDGSRMFNGCTNLVGGAGTAYSADHTDHTYAHIDGGENNPGYFTDRNANNPVPYAVLSENNTVLTFYYDENKTSRGGMEIFPFMYEGERGWNSNDETITRVVFDDSFANCSTVSSTAYWFYNLRNLTTVEGIQNLNTQNVTDMSYMFMYCSSLTTIDVTNFKTDNVTNMNSMFGYCFSLATIDVSGFNTEKVTGMWGMFARCNVLTSLDVSGFNTQNVTNMSQMFESCANLHELDVRGFNTQNVTNMNGMFEGCWRLKSLDLSSFNTHSTVNMGRLFYACDSLTTICIDSSWTTASVTVGDDMFTGCTSLVGGAGTTYSADHVDYTYAHIDGGTANPGYFTDKNATPLEKVATPTFSWRNDELTMSCSTEGATIMYQMSDEDTNGDGVINDDDYKQYSAPIEVKRDVIIKAIATKEGMTTSDPITLDYPYEAWTRLYETCIIGQEILSRASRSSRVPDQMRNQAQTYVDYALDMYGRRTADKDEVQGTREEIEIILSEIQQMMQVPASYSNYVLTAEEDATMAEIADQYGSYYGNQVAAIVWNSSVPMTESDLQRFTSNPNLLIYAQSESMVPANRDNVVINGVAKNVVLTDTVSGNCNFYAPQEFTAEAIQYTRTFSQQTQIGVSRGWEAIALPFTVQTYTHADRGVIAPFGNSASENHFWLRELTQNGLQNAQTIEANKPYIISMPNSEEYRPETNLAGQVTFSALNAIVPVTEATSVEYGSISLVPAFQSRSAQTEIYALNVGEERNGYPEGSVFERDYRTVRPFEAYTLHRDNQNPAPQFIMIGGDMGNGTTGIEELVDKRMNTNDSWYTIDGRKLQGAPTSKGLYIRNGKKVIVR